MSRRDQALKEMNDAIQILENAKKKMRISRNNINAIPIAFIRSMMLMMIEYGLDREEASFLLQDFAQENHKQVLQLANQDAKKDEP